VKHDTHNSRDAQPHTPGNQDQSSRGPHDGSAATRTVDYLTLGQIAAEVPSRPHSSCVWRWCRRGVKSRSGERIRLEHVRIGGKIFSTAAWLNEFGRRLAEADAQHFDERDDAADALAPRDPAYGLPGRARRLPSDRRSEQAGHDARLDEIERELEAEGL
jgi:hypothetical protein